MPVFAALAVLPSLASRVAPLAATSSTSVSHLQAIVLGLLQGFSELFPISSLGHTIILPKLLGWNINQTADSFLPFVVTLHVGTSIALIVYFWRDWVAIVTPMLASIKRGHMGDSADERLGWLLCAGTIPAAIVAVFVEKEVKNLFADPKVACAFLIVNGFLLYIGERLRLRAHVTLAAAGAGSAQTDARAPRPISTLSWTEAIGIGTSQILAFLPGISRSGATMVAGLASGLTHEAAARFSFLLATPIILAAGFVEIPSLFGGKDLGDAILGGVMAGIAAYLSVKFLMRYFNEAKNRLDPYAYYCWTAGCLAFIGIVLRG